MTLSRDMDKARANCPAHTGLAGEIRAVLERSAKPLSAYSISFLLGMRHAKVMKALSQMVTRQDGIVSVPGVKGYRLYTVYKLEPKPKGSGQVAGPVTIPTFRWGGTRLS